MKFAKTSARRSLIATLTAAGLLFAAAAPPAFSQGVETQIRVTAFAQAVAEAAARDDDLAAFYRARAFEGIWTGTDSDAVMRRNAFISALDQAAQHGLPAIRFNTRAAISLLQGASTPAEKGRAEVEMSRLLLDYARTLNSGLLQPRQVVSHIRREVHLRDRGEMLDAFMDNPNAMLRGLAPSTPEYQRLMQAKMRLESLLPRGGFGPAVQSTIRPGDQGAQVVALRNRLMAMDLLGHTVSGRYDTKMQEAVRSFQESMGLEQDAIVGGATLTALNVDARDRLESVLVAMERERWFNNLDRGDRYVWVNLVDFTAAIMDHDRETFRTKSVIGAQAGDRQTVEFSDTMEYMEINPYWYVPRSIINGEYGGRVPAGFEAVDYRGRIVQTSSAQNVSVRQRPGPRNALGSVKFMFPNQYNIYLHDTPSQSLFSRTVRTFSHGCIRLDDPHEFAYALLAAQMDDPEPYFQRILRSGANTRVPLETPLPVHLIYRTAFTSVDGRVHYRNDVYNRDARIWNALAAEGVVIGDVSG
ncbi:L,D-transpeptidase family protein [Roseisalinus antarcticus]|uniref:Murein L,D-transpeptidase n=1 Tax=Roseisalinus antarcticus TaxID=254357 RepID=A0A1Y5REM9_9RHOB|nr:L,D-transpeptidase family protein [Roseisalinus antarcticus]SLN15765.1 murein L,D-transpeptidase [Roseisalinus antarcticus]